jgi:translation initiation factor IF-1
MSKQRNPEGTVTDALGAGRFRVHMDDGKEVICYLAGKIKLKRIMVLVGDRVEVVLDPQGGTATNRIVWRK